MTVVCLHDRTVVDDTALAAIERVVPGHDLVVHVVADGTAVPDGCEVRFVPSPDGDEGREVLDPLLARFLREIEPTARTLGLESAIDGARHDWRIRAQTALHRCWVASQLRDPSTEKLLWITDGVPADADRWAAALAACAGCEVQPLAVAGAAPATPPIRRLARSARRRWRRSAPARSRPVAPVAGGALFVEPYAHIASMTADIAEAVGAHLPVTFIGTTDDVVDRAGGLAGACSAGDIAGVRSEQPRDVEPLVRRSPSAWGAALAPVPELVGPEVAAVMTAASIPDWRRGLAEDSRWRQVVADCAPRVVVASTESRTPARLAGIHGRQRGARYVVVQHGAQRPPPAFLRPIADRYAVWGRRDADALVAAGVDRDRVTITGRPGFAERIASARRERPAAPARPVVAYVPSVTGPHDVSAALAADLLAAVAAAVHSVQGSGTVRPHPRDRSGVYDVPPPPIRLDDSDDSLQAMAQADVVVVAEGTSGFEACALGRPVVALGWAGVRIPTELVDSGAASISRGPGDVAEALERALEDEVVRGRLEVGRAAVVEEIFGDLRPGAAARIATVVRDEAGSASPSARATGG